jgi:hypothetical protein
MGWMGIVLSVSLYHSQQILRIAIHIAQIAINKINRIIDFMGNTGYELSQARHFFTLNHLALGAMQCCQ